MTTTLPSLYFLQLAQTLSVTLTYINNILGRNCLQVRPFCLWFKNSYKIKLVSHNSYFSTLICNLSQFSLKKMFKQYTCYTFNLCTIYSLFICRAFSVFLVLFSFCVSSYLLRLQSIRRTTRPNGILLAQIKMVVSDWEWKLVLGFFMSCQYTND